MEAMTAAHRTLAFGTWLRVDNLDNGKSAEVRITDLRAEPRCERSWKRDGTVRKRSDGGTLSERDAQATGVA